VTLTSGSQRDGARLSLRRGNISLRAGFFSDEGHVHKTSAGALGLEVGGRTRWGDAAVTYIRMDRGVPGPGPDWPYGDGAAFAGELEDRLVIARVGLNPIAVARPGFYLIRQRQDYVDALSEPTHVTMSGGAIVDFDLDDIAPGAEITGSFDHSEMDSSDPLNPDLGVHSRTSASVVASHTVEHGILHFAVEGAGSYTSDFDAAATGALSVAAVSDPWRAWVSWGRSYRAPTMNELYWPEDSWSAGNENLEPESVRTLEAGGAGRMGPFRGSVSAYRSEAADLIGWVMSEVDYKSRPMNVGEARLRGVELELGADLGSFAVHYAATFASAEDSDTDKALPYRPETSQWIAVSTEAGALTTELRMRSAGEVYVDATEDEDRMLDGYSVIDFSARLELPWEGIAVGFDGLNIMDKTYETRQYYDMPGLEWRLSLMLGWEDDV
jgi:outer membrane receptor protein involved in Fe transport